MLASWTRDYEYQLELYCRHALGEFDDAELARRLESKPVEKDDRRARADRHRAVAAILREKDMPDGAIAELEQALAADPGYADAATDLAGILVDQGKLDEAEKRDHLEEAEQLLKEALIMNPDPVRARYYLGQLYQRKGEYQLAAEHYREALKRSFKER